MQVGMFRCVQTGSGRVVRSGPAFPAVIQVTENIKLLLPAGWTGIECLATKELNAWNNEVQFMMTRVAVPHPKDIALIRLQTCEGHLFKVIHDALLLFRGYIIVRMPRENPSSKFPFRIQRINEVTSGFYIPSHHFWRQLRSAWIIRTHKVMRGAIAPALPVGKNFHIHSRPPVSAGWGLSRNSRSRLTKTVSTSRVSARPL